MKSSSRYRWFVFGVFSMFILLHQADKLLIGPLTTPIMAHFGINRAQMGFVTTGALIVGGVFYPVWGYLYDRYARAKLLALAAFLWGSTTWLSAIAPTYPSFVVTRASTGIDDSSYPGLYSLISDYFIPQLRGKIFGLLQLNQPIGYLLGMMLGLFLAESVGWRGVFYITGGLGILLAGVILLVVREPPRGQTEVELADLEQSGQYHFNMEAARGLFQKRSLRLLFIQGFFGVFPWNVITYWIFNYLETERGYDSTSVFATMVVAILALAAGYPLGGALGDYFAKRTRRGRALVGMIGVMGGAALFTMTLSVPIENRGLFMFMMALTGLFIPVSAPNVISMVHDVTVPEVRSSGVAVQYIIESSGAALAPGIAGLIADAFSLHTAFLIICISAWVICGLLYVGVAYYLPGDIERLHQQLKQRAEEERAQTISAIS